MEQQIVWTVLAVVVVVALLAALGIVHRARQPFAGYYIVVTSGTFAGTARRVVRHGPGILTVDWDWPKGTGPVTPAPARAGRMARGGCIPAPLKGVQWTHCIQTGRSD